MSTEIIHHESSEIGDYVIRCVYYEYHADFTLYKIEYLEDDHPVYEGKDDSKHTQSIDDAQVYLHGSVKWDGCSNWYFDQQDQAMLHFCEKEELLHLGRLMALCWDLAAQHVVCFDHD
jgi:hypothetical protein